VRGILIERGEVVAKLHFLFLEQVYIILLDDFPRWQVYSSLFDLSNVDRKTREMQASRSEESETKPFSIQQSMPDRSINKVSSAQPQKGTSDKSILPRDSYFDASLSSHFTFCRFKKF
jgi:hypothetical protein